MKKKFLCVVLCLVCCFGFTGCGNAKLEARIAELQAQVDELQSHFTPSDKIYKLGETATIYSNGMPFVKVTYMGIDESAVVNGEGRLPKFHFEDLSSTPHPTNLGIVGIKDFYSTGGCLGAAHGLQSQSGYPDREYSSTIKIDTTPYLYLAVGFLTYIPKNYSMIEMQDSWSVIPCAIFEL